MDRILFEAFILFFSGVAIGAWINVFMMRRYYKKMDDINNQYLKDLINTMQDELSGSLVFRQPHKPNGDELN